jgi:hypothetical protein
LCFSISQEISGWRTAQFLCYSHIWQMNTTHSHWIKAEKPVKRRVQSCSIGRAWRSTFHSYKFTCDIVRAVPLLIATLRTHRNVQNLWGNFPHHQLILSCAMRNIFVTSINKHFLPLVSSEFVPQSKKPLGFSLEGILSCILLEVFKHVILGGNKNVIWESTKC